MAITANQKNGWQIKTSKVALAAINPIAVNAIMVSIISFIRCLFKESSRVWFDCWDSINNC